MRRLWLGGQRGCLSGKEQARIWALRECWTDEHDSEHGMYEHIRHKVHKVGGGHPSANAVARLLAKTDEDKEWFPGKHYGEKRGRKRVLVGVKATAVATSAKAQKTRGADPTYSSTLAACPDATLNPATGKPLSKKPVYTVFREKCYDDTAEKTWRHQARFSRTALTELQMTRRWDWSLFMEALEHSCTWYYKKLVWADICNSILARTEQKAQTLALARKGGKAWMSDGSQTHAVNLRGNTSALKQNSWDSVRIWWAPVLVRGKLHVELLGDDFPGETAQGAAALVALVRSALNVRFPGGDAPTMLFVDRGAGFYHPNTGGITDAFKDALRRHGLRAFMGDDAAAQPGALQEVMLHETAVAWIRYKLAQCVPARCWLETAQEFRARIKAVVAEINRTHDVDSLCRELPSRVQQVKAAEGGRINK
jgi:hypothetical protein